MRHRPSTVAAMLLVTMALTGSAWAGGDLTILEDVTVSGPVDGDVVAVAGNVTLEPGARVGGDVVAVLGHIDRKPGAEVRGRVVTVSSVAGLGLRSPGPCPLRTGIALKLLVTGGWLLAVNLVLVLFPGLARRAATDPRLLSPESALLGVVAVLTVFTALVAALGLGPLAPAGVVLLIALTLALKVLGLSALTARLGTRLVPRGAMWPVPLRASLALAVLLAFRLVPVGGALLWTVVSVFGIGSGLVAAATWRGALAPLPSAPGTGSHR